jgi:hypothetical protein
MFFALLVGLKSYENVSVIHVAIAQSTAEVVVEWELPTRRVDGTALPAADLLHTEIEYGGCTSDNRVDAPTTVTVLAPAVTTTVLRGPGPVCARARVLDREGQYSDYTLVARAVVPSGSAPMPPTNLRITFQEPLPPAQGYAVVGRSTSSGMTTKNKVYDVRSYGPQWVGELSVGVPCDCSDERTEAWGAGTGRYCRVDGQINETQTTYLALGAAFRAGSWTRCEAE